MSEPTTSMHRLERGKLYNPNRTTWPDGALNWTLATTGVELLMTFSRPTSAEVNDVRQGPAQFGLLAGDHALMIAHRFGAQPWADAPWQLSRQEVGGYPAGLTEVGTGQHLLVQIVLVDADTGIIKALRGTTWPEPFVTALRAAIERQRAAGGRDRDGQQEIERWYARFATTPDLVANADLVIAGGR